MHLQKMRIILAGVFQKQHDQWLIFKCLNVDLIGSSSTRCFLALVKIIKKQRKECFIAAGLDFFGESK